MNIRQKVKMLVCMYRAFEIKSKLWLTSKAVKAGDINLGEAPDFNCNGVDGALPHPAKCDLYYLCWQDFVPTLWQCRDNLVFDLVYSGCNYQQYTDCGDRIPPGQGK